MNKIQIYKKGKKGWQRMRPVSHLVAGGVLTGIGATFFSREVAAGAFLWSIILDMDHIIIMRQAGIKPRAVIHALVSRKKFQEMLHKVSETVDMLYGQYDIKPWLDIAFLHTAEVLLSIFALAVWLQSGFLWAMWGAMIFHIFLDYCDVFWYNRDSLRLRSWSIIQYFILKSRGEQIYSDVWPRK